MLARLVVGGMYRSETRAIISYRLGRRWAVSDDVVGLVHRRTDGNPFFIVEIARDLLGQGGHGDGNGARDPADADGADPRTVAEAEVGTLAATAVPTTVREAIVARLARLGPHTALVLEAASILRDGFSFDEILLVAGLEEDATAQALDEAERSGLVRSLDVTRGGDHAAGYAFDHALTQDAVSSLLSSARRRMLHRAAGLSLGRLEDPQGAERASEIADHLRLGGAPGLALRYYQRAGERAADLFAHGDAERHLRTAAELAGSMNDAPATARAREQLGVSLTALTRYEDAFDELERAAVAYRRVGDLGGVRRVEQHIANAHFRQGTPAVGAARLATFLANQPREPLTEAGRRELGALWGALARLFYADGRYADCRTSAERALRLAPVDDARLLAEVELMRGLGLVWSDRPDDGSAALEHAVAMAEQAGATETWCTACLPLHLVSVLRGEFARGRHYSDVGIRLAERADDVNLLAMHLANVGNQQTLSGDWSAAERSLSRAVSLAGAARPSYFACLPPAYLGALRLVQGRFDEASTHLSDAASIAAQVGNPEVRGYAEARAAELDVARGRGAAALDRLGHGADGRREPTWWFDVIRSTVEAEAHNQLGHPHLGEQAADRALERAAVMANRVDGVVAMRARAESLALQGRFDEATAALDLASADARSMGYPYAEARLLETSGSVLALRGDRPAAAVSFASAVDGFRALGARADMDRADRRRQQVL
jgi:tetratricopeptide (TPR) repeat protein